MVKSKDTPKENATLKEELNAIKSDQNDFYNQQKGTIENQLKMNKEERDKCCLEKRQFQVQISKFAQLNYEEIIAQLKLDLKQMKLFLKCSQKEHKENPDKSINASRMIKTLKTQIEDLKQQRKICLLKIE